VILTEVITLSRASLGLDFFEISIMVRAEPENGQPPTSTPICGNSESLNGRAERSKDCRISVNIESQVPEQLLTVMAGTVSGPKCGEQSYNF